LNFKNPFGLSRKARLTPGAKTQNRNGHLCRVGYRISSAEGREMFGDVHYIEFNIYRITVVYIIPVVMHITSVVFSFPLLFRYLSCYKHIPTVGKD